MKKCLFCLVLAVSVMTSFSSFADGPFYSDVKIVSIEQTESKINVIASNPDPTKWQNFKFSIDNSKQNEQLAILLTAMAAGNQVGITFTTGPNMITGVKNIN